MENFSLRNYGMVSRIQFKLSLAHGLIIQFVSPDVTSTSKGQGHMGTYVFNLKVH